MAGLAAPLVSLGGDSTSHLWALVSGLGIMLVSLAGLAKVFEREASRLWKSAMDPHVARCSRLVGLRSGWG